MDNKYTGLLERKIPISSFFQGLGLLSLFIYIIMLVAVSSLAAVYANAMKILFIVIVVCAAAYALLTRRKLSFNPSVAALLGFAVFVLLTCVWADNKTIALDGAKRMLELIALSIGIYVLIDNEDSVRMVINAFLIGGLVMICWALGTYGLAHTIKTITEGGRVALMQANLFSAILNLTNAIMMFYILFERKYWYFIPLVISLILLIGTGSRTGFIVTCVQLIIYIIIKTKQNGLKFAIPAIAVLLISIIVVLPRFIDISSYGERIESIGDFLTEDADELSKEETRDGSLIKRKIMLDFGKRLIAKKPIHGYGLGHYEYYFNIEYGEERPPHSTYIQLMVSTGLIGSVLYYANYVLPAIYFTGVSMKSKKKKADTAPAVPESGRRWGKALHTPGGYSPLFLCIIAMYLANNLSTNMMTNKFPFVFFGAFAAYVGMIRNYRRAAKEENKN